MISIAAKLQATPRNVYLVTNLTLLDKQGIGSIANRLKGQVRPISATQTEEVGSGPSPPLPPPPRPPSGHVRPKAALAQQVRSDFCFWKSQIS